MQGDDDMNYIVPERIAYTAGHGFCPGCGHGIAIRLVGEALQELQVEEKTIAVVDVACCYLAFDNWQYDSIMAAHGRPVATAVGVKHMRKNNTVFAYLGDGAAYSIGISETIHAAIRNENITVITVNNGVFGMTGGQMAPTTLDGQVTSSTPRGRDPVKVGHPIHVEDLIGNLEMAYLARGALNSPANIRKAKEYIKKAFKKQQQGCGYSYVELLSPCPTNWGLEPVDAIKRIGSDVLKEYPIGEFINAEECRK